MGSAGGGTAEREGSTSRRWLFAEAVLDERSQTLLVNGQPAELDPKPLEVLRHLLHHAGELVTKDELLAAVWPGRVLSDAALTSCVARLRCALADDEQAIIKTVHGYGYRLIAPIKVEASAAAPPPRFDFKPGDHPAGRPSWSFVERLGTGGHGEVWLARQDKTGEPRIFKYALDEQALPSLKREITLSRFLHDTLGDGAPFVRVLDWNLEKPPYCIEAQYTQGGSLVSWAKAQGGIGKVPKETRIALASKIAQALAAAHAVGVLHKDLKPSNVLIETTGDGVPQIRLSDFGSGGVLEPGRLDALGITRLGLTMTQGMSPTSGTPIYLAPELIAEQPATMQTDIYALGVLLYQLVIGDLKRPLAPGWEHDVEDELLREDIAAAAAGNPARRLKDADALLERLKGLEQRRAQRAVAKPAPSATRPRRRRAGWAVLAAAAGVLAAGLLAYQYRDKPTAAAAPSYALAVLPFTSANPETGHEGFTHGLFLDLSGTLSQLPGLRTAPRAAVMPYRDSPQDAAAIARELRAAAVLTGQVTRQGEQIEIKLQLTQPDGSPAWSQRYERSLKDLLVLEDAIVLDLAAQMGVMPDDAAQRELADHGTGNAEAYDLYLQAEGRAVGPAVQNVSRPLLESQLAQLQQAVALAPEFARAYAALALRYQTLVYWHTPDDRATLKKGFAAAERALELRPGSVDAHVAISQLSMTPLNGFDFKLGIQSAKRALALDPQAHAALAALTIAYPHIGLFDEARVVTARSAELNPQNPMNQIIAGGNEIWEGHAQQGLDILETISARDVFPRLWYWLGAWGLMDLGRNMQAEARIEEYLKAHEDTGGLLTGRRALLHAVMGDYALAEKGIAVAAAHNPMFGHFHHTAYDIGCAYAVMNRPAEALKWLTQAADRGFPNYPAFTRERNLDKIRGDAGFIKLLERLRRQHEDYRALAAAPAD